jgi:hypothetical protein
MDSAMANTSQCYTGDSFFASGIPAKRFPFSA